MLGHARRRARARGASSCSSPSRVQAIYARRSPASVPAAVGCVRRPAGLLGDRQLPVRRHAVRPAAESQVAVRVQRPGAEGSHRGRQLRLPARWRIVVALPAGSPRAVSAVAPVWGWVALVVGRGRACGRLAGRRPGSPPTSYLVRATENLRWFGRGIGSAVRFRYAVTGTPTPMPKPMIAQEAVVRCRPTPAGAARGSVGVRPAGPSPAGGPPDRAVVHGAGLHARRRCRCWSRAISAWARGGEVSRQLGQLVAGRLGHRPGVRSSRPPAEPARPLLGRGEHGACTLLRSQRLDGHLVPRPGFAGRRPTGRSVGRSLAGEREVGGHRAVRPRGRRVEQGRRGRRQLAPPDQMLAQRRQLVEDVATQRVRSPHRLVGLGHPLVRFRGRRRISSRRVGRLGDQRSDSAVASAIRCFASATDSSSRSVSRWCASARRELIAISKSSSTAARRAALSASSRARSAVDVAVSALGLRPGRARVCSASGAGGRRVAARIRPGGGQGGRASSRAAVSVARDSAVASLTSRSDSAVAAPITAWDPCARCRRVCSASRSPPPAGP